MNSTVNQPSNKSREKNRNPDDRPESDILPVQIPSRSESDKITMLKLFMGVIYLCHLLQWFKFIGKNIIDITLDEYRRNL